MEKIGDFLFFTDDETSASGLRSPVPASQAPNHAALLRKVLQSRRIMAVDPERFGLSGVELEETKAQMAVLEGLIPQLAAVALDVEAQEVMFANDVERFVRGGESAV